MISANMRHRNVLRFYDNAMIIVSEITTGQYSVV